MSPTKEPMSVNDESQPAAGEVLAAKLDLSSLIGQWTNTNSATRGISHIVISEDGKNLRVQTFGACASGSCDWGEGLARTYAYSVAGDIVAGFELTYDFGSQEALVTAIHNRGVLVIHAYHRFKVGSGRSNFISKEFFHQ
ncbi:MAG TPA: hypothetical protein VK581_08720 [Chthoniobacterales bacterium]|nr:hypothetical protein [Chthoniobacterales bacterium]